MLKIGIIGCGHRGIKCFGELLKEAENVKISALCDPNHVRLQCASDLLNIKPQHYDTTEEMFRSEELDAVVITSPDYCHEENAISALNNGVNVLIDKPLATTVEGCHKIINAAEKNNLLVMMGFNLRHHPVLVKLKELIDNDVLGKIFLIQNQEFYDEGRTYMSRWNRFYSKSGGLWIHKGSHDFDIFNWLLNFPKPERVSAFAAVNAFSADKIPFEVKSDLDIGPTCRVCPYREICPDVFDIENLQDDLWQNQAAEFDGYYRDCCMYTSEKDTHDNGIAIVEYAGGIKASHMECFVSSICDRIFTIVGDRGQAEVSLEKRKITIIPRWNKPELEYKVENSDKGHGGADPILVDNFLQVLSGKTPNKATTQHGLLATAIGQAAEISRREHRMVNMLELL